MFISSIGFSAESSFYFSAQRAIVIVVIDVFAERIKKLRKNSKETQQVMADKLNVSQRTIANWEAGERLPSYDVLVKIADMYMVSTDYLLGRTDDPMYEHKWTKEDGSIVMHFSTTEKEPLTPDRRKELEKQVDDTDTKEIVIQRKALPKDRKELEQFVLEILQKQQQGKS